MCLARAPIKLDVIDTELNAATTNAKRRTRCCRTTPRQSSAPPDRTAKPGRSGNLFSFNRRSHPREDVLGKPPHLGLEGLELQHEQLHPSLVERHDPRSHFVVTADQPRCRAAIGADRRLFSVCMWFITTAWSILAACRARIGAFSVTSASNRSCAACASAAVSRVLTKAERPKLSGGPRRGFRAMPAPSHGPPARRATAAPRSSATRGHRHNAHRARRTGYRPSRIRAVPGVDQVDREAALGDMLDL